MPQIYISQIAHPVTDQGSEETKKQIQVFLGKILFFCIGFILTVSVNKKKN